MAKESIIHIKLGYSEALQAKRSILTSQATLIKIAKRIENYNNYRTKELEAKQTLQKNFKELRANITKLKNILPSPKLPNILKKSEEKEESQEKNKKPRHNTGLDYELKEIEKRLEELQRI